MSLGQQLAPHLPFLRRYGRALTGSQSHGDKYVRATLEAIVAAPDEFPKDVDPRLGLYRMFQAIWSSANYDEMGDEGVGDKLCHDRDIPAGGTANQRCGAASTATAAAKTPPATPETAVSGQPGLRR